MATKNILLKEHMGMKKLKEDNYKDGFLTKSGQEVILLFMDRAFRHITGDLDN